MAHATRPSLRRGQHARFLRLGIAQDLLRARGSCVLAPLTLPRLERPLPPPPFSAAPIPSPPVVSARFASARLTLSADFTAVCRPHASSTFTLNFCGALMFTTRVPALVAPSASGSGLT